MNNILADKLELWGFENDYVVFADGSLGFGLSVEQLDVSCFCDESSNDLSEKIKQFLNSLPAGISLQFVQDINKGNGDTINRYEKSAALSENEIAKSLSSYRIEHLKRDDDGGLIPRFKLFLFIRKSPSQALFKKPSLFAKKKLFAEITEEAFQKELSHAEKLKQNIVNELTTLGLSSETLSADEMIQMIYRQWNPARVGNLPQYDPEDIRTSLLFTDIGVYEKGFSLSDYHHRVISLKILPDQTFASMATVLNKLPFSSRLFFTLHVPDQIKEIESLKTQRRIAYSMAFGKKSGVSDIESTAKFTDLENILEEMIAQGEKIFYVALNVLLVSKDKNILDDQSAQVLSVIREMAGAEAMEETLASFTIFSQCSLPNARATERQKRMKTSNVTDFLPLYSPWRGHEKPTIFLKSRMGSLLNFDPFDVSLANANQLVSGGSGSGKSFMVNLLLLQLLKENPKVFILDIGGSYKKLCDNLSGQYLELGVDNHLSINPFDLGANEKVPSSHKTKFLVGLIELIAKEEESKRLSKLIRAEIEEAIGKTYETSHHPTLSDLKNILSEHKDVEIRRIGRILNSWTGDTPFGRFIDRETTVELKRNIIAFDLKGLESYPDLQVICLYIITDLVWRNIQQERNVQKFLVFDEAWQLLKDPAARDFIESVFRTFRKYYASAIAISQDINDFAKSYIASAILPNCAVKWILMQQQSNDETLKNVLSLNENEIELVKSLHQDKGVYSEAFLMAGTKSRSVAVIEPTPLELWIATTDPRDLAAIEREKQHSPQLSQLEILKSLANKYPHGVSVSAN